MFSELTNQPRPYQWGDKHSIATWQGRVPSGTPEAELWWGSHPGSEAIVSSGSRGEEPEPVSAWLSAKGVSPALPFLVKLLAADSPLSLQVHPTRKQAIAGFAAENASGMSVDDPRRNYRDASDKPEILIAWSDEFLALAGAQSLEGLAGTVELIASVVSDGSLVDSARAALTSGPEALIQWAFSAEQSIESLAHALTEAWGSGVVHKTLGDGSELARVWDRVIDHYPGDRGIVAASFLNCVSLSRGEAIFIPAGVPHAYLQGFGLEVMAPSDNVLRGGLTPKHIDREELARILDPAPYPNPIFEPLRVGEGIRRFSPRGVPFQVHHAQGTEVTLEVPVGGPVGEPAVVVVESGAFRSVSNSAENQGAEILQGGRAYVGVISGPGAVLEGSGSVFIVSS